MFKHVCEMFAVVLELGPQPEGPAFTAAVCWFPETKKRPLRPHEKTATSRITGVIYGKWQGWLQACETGSNLLRQISA